MHILAMGLPFWGDRAHLERYKTGRDHEVRTLAISGDAHYRLGPRESAAEVIARVSAEWPFDVLVCFVPELFPPPHELEACPVKTVAVISDWNVYYPQLEFNLARYDIVLSDELGSRTLSPQGAKTQYVTPLYSHLGLVHRELGLERDLDIVFAGNLNPAMHPRRTKLLERIALLSDEFRIAIVEGLEQKAYVKLLNRARIAFNCSLRGEMNLRCFEAPACGALLFLESDNLEAPALLRDREECVYYNDENLIELLKAYLAGESERSRIAANGQGRIAEIEAIHRLDMLFDWIERQPAGARDYRQFGDIEKRAATILQYASSLEKDHVPITRVLIRDALLQDSESPEILLIAGCDVLPRGLHASGEEQKSLLHDAMGLFKAACDRSPGEAVPLFNFAFACGLIGLIDAEAERLERCLLTKKCSWGGLLLGRSDDPYYGEWRRQLARGAAGIELVHAATCARLAEIYNDNNEYRDALLRAGQAIAFYAACPMPYRQAARAHMRLGDAHAAVNQLVAGLPFSALDIAYRHDLIAAYRAAGNNQAAEALERETALIQRAVKSAADLQ
jgi:hypothetical protein